MSKQLSVTDKGIFLRGKNSLLNLVADQGNGIGPYIGFCDTNGKNYWAIQFENGDLKIQVPKEDGTFEFFGLRDLLQSLKEFRLLLGSSKAEDVLTGKFEEFVEVLRAAPTESAPASDVASPDHSVPSVG